MTMMVVAKWERESVLWSIGNAMVTEWTTEAGHSLLTAIHSINFKILQIMQLKLNSRKTELGTYISDTKETFFLSFPSY